MLYVTFSEISLKGKNRLVFENQLRKNIREALKELDIDVDIRKKYGVFIIKGYNVEDEKLIKSRLSKVFGISYIYNLKLIERDLSKIVEEIKNLRLEKVNLKVKRIDKKFPILSPEIKRSILKEANLEDVSERPRVVLKIDTDYVYLLFDPIEGPGGLPAGSLGKVVCLLSSGIDSPVAAWMMMKRGCSVILLHLNSYEDELEKVKKNYEVLRSYGSSHVTLKVIKKEELFGDTCQKLKGMERRYSCLLFKNFLYEVASKIADEEGALAIANGDSLGQVASQTLENIYVTRYGIKYPILSPLIGLNKEEIMEIARKVGTYEISILKDTLPPYIPKRPITRAKLDKFLKIKERVIEKIKNQKKNAC